MFTLPSCPLSKETERVGEKTKHLPKSLTLAAREVPSCMRSFRERASEVPVATANRRHEPGCHTLP